MVDELFSGEEAWVVGGAVRDQALGRPLVDVDVALRDPEAAARRLAARVEGAPFPLSERHGAWRVVLEGGRTVDFTPLPGPIEDDLATRDFSINAIAERVGSEEIIDPYDGYADLAAKRLKAVKDSVFVDDPLRLLRAVRLEDELDFRLDEGTEALVREHAELVTRPAAERIVSELSRLSPGGYRRLDALGLLAPLGGTIDDRLERWDSPDYRLVAVFGEGLRRFPLPNELRRQAAALLRAEPPAEDARSIHRFRRATEPWALEALAYVGADGLREAVERARSDEPTEPLLRGDELGLPPGPEIGRLLAEIEEERAAGTIATREEALDYARRSAGAVREDG
ncbi:MAG: poly(A) polymerase [Gaiellaceae bacterium]|jgi:tRNA nucleotidyltransferase/poly(A) polymerase|nr:poly(A) polymerase [Gaiellaceae bacterium]